MRRALLLLLLLTGVVVIAVGGKVAVAELVDEPAPSPVIFPKQSIPLSFSHVEHLTREKMDCAFCHENAPDSTKSSDNNIPKEDTCTVCHDIERDKPNKEVEAGKPDAKCISCHPGWNGTGEPPRVVVPTPNLEFNHKVHLGRKIRCQTCHGDLQKQGVGLATRDNLPRMPVCLTCHDSKTAPQKCTTCHISEPGGFVKTQYAEGVLAPSGVLRGDAHDLRFRTEHARVAANNESYCANCHKKDFCTGCHNGVTKPLDFHGNDYVSLHPIDARRNTPDCAACHRLQTFCTGCHSRSGVSTDVHTGQFDLHSTPGAGPNHFHSEGWFSTYAERRPDHHSFQAQRNIKACASCHREDFCLGCHSADLNTSQGINPHPGGFAQSFKCRALAAKNGRMCLRCHLDANEARCM